MWLTTGVKGVLVRTWWWWWWWWVHVKYEWGEGRRGCGEMVAGDREGGDRGQGV